MWGQVHLIEEVIIVFIVITAIIITIAITVTDIAALTCGCLGIADFKLILGMSVQYLRTAFHGRTSHSQIGIYRDGSRGYLFRLRRTRQLRNLRKASMHIRTPFFNVGYEVLNMNIKTSSLPFASSPVGCCLITEHKLTTTLYRLIRVAH